MSDKIIKLVTVLPVDMINNLVENRRMTNVDTMPQLNRYLKQTIKKYIRENIGYDNEPIAALSRNDGMASELRKVQTGVSSYLPVNAKSTLWQLHMPVNMATSVNFKDLLQYSRELNEAEKHGDREEIEFLCDEFYDRLTLGYLEQDDVISFIPFIDLNKCKFVAAVGKSWEMSTLDVPGVEEIKLTNLDMFVH